MVVRRNLVKPSFMSDDKITLKLADNRLITVPKATVYIKSKFFNGSVEAACMSDLPFDVIIGNVKGAHCACGTSSTDPKNLASFALDSTESYDHACVVTRAQAQEEVSDLPRSYKIGKGEIQMDMISMKTEQFIKLQQNDVTLKPFFKKSENVCNTFPKLVVVNGVLVRVTNSRENLKDMLHQVLVPAQLRPKIISLAHDAVLAGHLGTTKTINRILQHFYWPGLQSDVRIFCRSCSTCQFHSKTKPAKVPLVNLPVINEPFSRVALDIVGPLEKSARGNRFILVSIDLATKYPDAVPLKKIDSDTVAEAMLEIYARVGLPQEILHDQGKNFMSSVMRKFNQLLRIKSINTTPYNPRCNGTCEAFNKVFKQMIRKVVNDEPQFWDKFLQPLLFAYREVPQCSTGFSPFELLFGHTVRGPLFLLKERILEDVTDPEQVPITEHVMKMREKIREYMNISNDNEKFMKIKEKAYYDKLCRQRSLKSGDKVLLLLPTSYNKLLAEWRGPYDVIRKINSVDYVIRIGEKERVFHINMLKRYYERQNGHVSASVCEVDYGIQSDGTNGENHSIGENGDHIGRILDHDREDYRIGEGEDHIGRILEHNSSIFSDIPGKILCPNYTITMSDVKPVASLPYKIPFNLKERVKLELCKWEENGIIRKSDSQWTFPMVVVRNNDESIRLTIDYRKINPFISTDNFPMLSRETVIEKLYKSEYLTKLDLTKAYLQIPLEEHSKKFTSFVCEFGQFEFNVVPFGIKFASGLCNRLIKSILSDCDSFVTSYVDDLVVHSETFEEHLEHLDIVLSKLKSAGVTLNLSKCRFSQSEIKFLGVRVGGGKVKPDPSKTIAIRDFQKPVNKKMLRSYLGLLSFYRVFVPNLSSKITPLTNLLRKNCPDKIKWTDELLETFNISKNLICDKILLSIPKPGHKFIIQTDASNDGLGAVLGQQVDGQFSPVAFISRTLSKAELNYAVIEKECLAIKWAIEYFHQYLCGAKFCVKTDHAPLSWLNKNKNKNSRLMRWALSLQGYDFNIEYIKGSENFLADMLSRAMQS